MKRYPRFACVLMSLLSFAAASADDVSRDLVWTTIPAMPPDVVAMDAWIRPAAGQAVVLDQARLADVLRAAPLEDTPAAVAPIVVWFPRPDGAFERFWVLESPILAPDLAAARPDLKTYRGWGIDDPFAVTRFDTTPEGVHALVSSPSGRYFIDPFSRGDTVFYTSYAAAGYAKPVGQAWSCVLLGEAGAPGEPDGGVFEPRALVNRRQYRLALACTGEYTAVFAQAGDSDAQKKARAQNAMTTSINRVNVVYENDLGIRLSLINNTNIIYTSAASDPYTNDDGGAMLSQNQSTLDGVVGAANYDIGHVFSTGGGGIAGLGVVCRSGNKARGVTGLPSPFNDPFDIDYVAHEMGHQFGAPHTFMGTASACSGNASAGDAYEPGSGSTIMAYAGICGSDNLQAHSDACFHHSSIQRIQTYVAGSGNCSSNTATTNNTPVLSAGPNLTVPANTPLALTPASAADPDGDPLTFSWEPRDAAVRALPTADPGTGSIFRPRIPSVSPTQYFPPLDDVVDGSLDRGDLWPATTRTMNFRLAARDNRAGGGGVTITASNRTLSVTTAAGPFAVIYPNAAITLNGNSTIAVAWSVAGTTSNGVNCANVDILASVDNGLTFPYILASAVPNDGSHSVVLPNVQTNTARIMVRGTAHAFYDISDRGFRINQTLAPPADPASASATPSLICQGQSTQLFAAVGEGEEAVWYAATCGGPAVATGNPVMVTPSSSTVYFAKARRLSDGGLSLGCASVIVSVGSSPTAPTSASASRDAVCPGDGQITLTAAGGSGSTLRWLAGSCAGTTVGVGDGLTIPAPAATTTYFARWETSCGVSACAAVTVNVLPAAVAPSLADADRTTVCASDTGTITLSAVGGSGSALVWTADACGGAPLGSGTTLLVDSPPVTTTYFASWTGPCGPSACASVTVVVSSGPDFNGDGFVDFFDYDDFVICFETGACPPGASADYNGDGFADFFDYDDFVHDFENGC